MSKKTIKEQVLTFLETNIKKKLTMEEIAQGLELESSKDFKQLVQAVAALEQEKLIVFNKKGRILLPNNGLSVEGTFRANERGFGFVTIDPEEPDIYIPKEAVNYAMNGDSVEVKIVQSEDIFTNHVAEGKITAIKQRAITQLVGEFFAYDELKIKETHAYGYMVPKDKKLTGFTVTIVAEGIKPINGSIVIAEITHYPEKCYIQQLRGITKKIIGYKDDPGVDILSTIIAHDIPVAFSEEVIEEANYLSDNFTEEELLNRKDLRDQQIVTIDGEDAKDLDDAVTVKKLNNGNYYLGVHIADVSHYVKEGSFIDKEAYERGTSVYLIDRVIPMIPQRLSNDICSLNPKVPRLTLGCEMEINHQGKVVHHEIFPSVIQTAERMTYTAVNEILEDQNTQTMRHYQSLVPMFKEMQELHLILSTMREQRGALSFDDHESRIIVNEAGEPQRIELRERGIGERIVESFMLIANETVAKHYHDLKLPFIYRIHEQPKEEKMQRFFDFISILGILIKGSKSEITPKDLQSALKKVMGRPEEAVVNTILLRSMQQARYSENNYGHYGLAATYYTHFTSPIRRYPDLIVHRLIHTYNQDSSEKTKERWATQLPDIANHSSQMERRATEVEREVDSMKKAEFMAGKIGEVYNGIISSVTKFGIFVELPNTIEGLIHVNNLKQDYFHFIEKHLALVGERTGITLKIGQKVSVRVEKADPDTREIDFELLEVEKVDALMVPEKYKRRSKNHYKKQTEKKNSPKKQTVADKTNKKKKNRKKPFYKEVAKKKKVKNRK